MSVTLQARDSSAFLSMPFPFRYYGQTFDSLTVNENGWLTAGISHDHSYFNSRIPGLAGPSAMIAPLWDNLHDGDAGEICYAYDTVGGRFIVEYCNIQYSPPGARFATFQVQIHSTLSRPTPSGDCEIEFLYKRIDNVNQAVIGIENPAENVGLQLLNNGVYDANTWLIAGGSSVRFTTRTSAVYGRITGQVITHPQAADLSQAVVRVGGRVIPVSLGGQYAADSLLNGWYQPTLMLSGYERTARLILIASDSLAFVNLEAWRLDPPTDLTAAVQGATVVLHWRRPECLRTGTRLDEFQSYRIYRNGECLASATDTSYSDSLTAGGTYDYYTTAEYAGGNSDSSNHVAVIIAGTPDVPESPTPKDFELTSCWPNPFNSTATIEFTLPITSSLKLEVFDLLGRRVSVLTSGIYEAGRHHIPWNCRECSTGLYWIVMSGPGFHRVQKAMLLK